VAALALSPAAQAATPKPRTGKTVVASRHSGTVKVKPRGAGTFVKLGKARSLPVGSTIDATNGKVNLTATANAKGTKTQSGLFYGGAFIVTQKSSSMTDLQLVGGSFAGCDQELQRSGGVFAARARPRRHLWGDAHGHFRTRGRNGSATVRGTKWLTEDRCAGTAEATDRGMVNAASDDGLAYDVGPGEAVSFHCEPNGLAGVSSLYCLALLEDTPEDIYAYGIASSDTPDTSYDICVTYPDGVERCDTNLPFDTSDPQFVSAGYGCSYDQAGAFIVRWRIRGQYLPVPLTFNAPRASQFPGCVSSPPRPGIDDTSPALARAAAGRL
jgi:hypothetical protein